MKFDAPNLDWNNRDDEDDAQGGIMDADPDKDEESEDEHWLPCPPNVNPNTFWSGMSLYLFLTEDSLFIPKRGWEVVEYLMKLEDAEE